MAAGQAIVTCDGTGCPEVVGDDALLVPPRRPDRLGEALGRLVGNDQLRAELGRRARARVEQEFGWQSIARRHVDALPRSVRPTAGSSSRWWPLGDRLERRCAATLPSSSVAWGCAT